MYGKKWPQNAKNHLTGMQPKKDNLQRLRKSGPNKGPGLKLILP